MSLIEHTNKDYRNLFNFTLFYPILVNKEHRIEEIVLSLYEQGLVPVSIITDKRHSVFKHLKTKVLLDFYNNTTAIIIPIGFNTKFTS